MQMHGFQHFRVFVTDMVKYVGKYTSIISSNRVDRVFCSLWFDTTVVYFGFDNAVIDLLN